MSHSELAAEVLNELLGRMYVDPDGFKPEVIADVLAYLERILEKQYEDGYEEGVDNA